MRKKHKQGPNAQVIVKGLPEPLINHITEKWLKPNEKDASLIASPTLFKPSSERLFQAIVMGEETIVKALVDHDPESLFTPGTFRMPCINADGTPSKDSKLIFHS